MEGKITSLYKVNEIVLKTAREKQFPKYLKYINPLGSLVATQSSVTLGALGSNPSLSFHENNFIRKVAVKTSCPENSIDLKPISNLKNQLNIIEK